MRTSRRDFLLLISELGRRRLINNIVYDTVNRLHDILYPPRCPVCDDVLFVRDSLERPRVCPGCLAKISFIQQPACMRCGKQLEENEREFCHDCGLKEFSFKRGVAAFSYSDVIKASMYSFKYNNRREYADYYSRCIYDNYSHIIQSWNAQILIPVPLHSSKLRKRGYNQAEILAQGISQLLDIPVDSHILQIVKKTRPQKELNDKERYNNLENAFQICCNSVKYKNIILVDDIYTTGATIEACTRELLAKGALNVYFITACIGRGF